MKPLKKNSTKQNVGLQNISIGKPMQELDSCNKMIQELLSSKEKIENYISFSLSKGDTRRKAISELNSCGVYLSKVKL
jgi:hypothetical protein